jgi:hypothetical protein
MKPKGWYSFLSGFPSFDTFLLVVSIRKRCIHIKIRCNKRKTNATIKGKQRDNVNKGKPPFTFSCCCERSHRGDDFE